MDNENSLSQTWKTPNELIKLHRLKLKQKALNARLQGFTEDTNKEVDKQTLLEAACTRKRKNPFAKNVSQVDKKQKIDACASNSSENNEETQNELSNHNNILKSTIYNSASAPRSSAITNLLLKPTWNKFDPESFANIFNETSTFPADNEEIHEQACGDTLPIDWNLKSRMRILCETELPATNLKTNQEASGLTGFVRCVDRLNSTNNLDISLGAQFNQCTHYWQHPHLPWFTLFPRNSKNNIGIQIGERERDSLMKDWIDSFRGLFQLLRARQCPYFYLCANSFTVLFRAAGIGGRAETHALMTPTSRGMRSALKQEEIEFSMPLKKEGALNRSKEGTSASTIHDELTKSSDIYDEDLKNNESCGDDNDEDEDDDDEAEEKWLESLGVSEIEIKKISSSRVREKLNEEITDDFSDNSIILIEGVDCQAFFNFLLNAKSTVPNSGRLAGIPPTLLSPVAFPKATMETLTTRSSKVRSDGNEYFSLEIKGTIMPHILPYINTLLCESKNSFSVTLAATNNNTMAFSKASQKLLDNLEKEATISNHHIFRKENLSDCGLPSDTIDLMCKTNRNSVSIIERMCFNKEIGFFWS